MTTFKAREMNIHLGVLFSVILRTDEHQDQGRKRERLRPEFPTF